MVIAVGTGVILGSLSRRDQFDRYVGFEETLRSRFPALRVLPVCENHCDPRESSAIAGDLIRRHDDLVAIYSGGAGNSGIIDAIETADAADRIVFVMHELSERAARGLRSGVVDAVLNQDTGHMARSAVRVLKAHCLGTLINSQQERIRMDICLADSLP